MTIGSPTYTGHRRSASAEFASSVATIMVKELRSRMRGRRAFVVLTLYLTLLALIAYGVYVVVAPIAVQQAGEGGFGGAQANASSLIGQSIFTVLSIFQIILVSVIAPAFTAGQISLEREKQTLDLLITTPMRPGAIIIGKLLTALAFVVLMIVAAVPITAIVLMYGGAGVDDIVRQQLVLLAVAVGFGAVGIFASALTKRTQTATVLTYCTVLAFTLGTAMVYAFWEQVSLRNETGIVQQSDRPPEPLRYVNPMIGMLDVIARVEATGPTAFSRSLYELFGQDLALGAGFEDVRAVFEPQPPDGVIDADISKAGGLDYWWPRVALTFIGLGGILTAASTRLVVPAGMRWPLRPPRRDAGSMEADGSSPTAAPTIEEFGEAER